MRRACSARSFSSSITPEPGITGTPASTMVRRASSLSPIRAITWSEGPMNLMRHCWHSRANRGFSDSSP